MRNRFVIDEEFIAKIESLETVIRNNIAGVFGGNRRSKSYGSSCEFADYRDYMAGDDTDRIDCNAFARFDKLFVKLYLDERQMHTRIYIDASRSMEYGDGKKAEQAIKIAAALAYISVCEMDKVTIYTVKGKTVDTVISSMVGKDSYISSIGLLNNIEFDGDSYISDAILPTAVGYGDGMSVILSDFLTDNDYESAIDYLVANRRDVLCVQILAREEQKPQFRGKYHFFDSEDQRRDYRKNIDGDIAAAYKRALEYVTERISGYCEARGASYQLVTAEDALFDVFFGSLAEREVLK